MQTLFDLHLQPCGPVGLAMQLEAVLVGLLWRRSDRHVVGPARRQALKQRQSCLVRGSDGLEIWGAGLVSVHLAS